MKIYCGITAVFCIAYYLVIVFYAKKWNSTFSIFWPAAGMIHMILPTLPYSRVIAAILVIGWVLFLLIEVQIFRAMRTKNNRQTAWLIILGAQVRGRTITNSLMRRLDTALHYVEQHPGTKIIVSGGQGKGEDIAEAAAMSSYLIQRGVDKSDIYLEDKSTSTWENLRNSGKIIGDITQPIAVVTNNFHIYRAVLMGKRIGFKNLVGIAASSNPIFQLNYLVREFFAVLSLLVRHKN